MGKQMTLWQFAVALTLVCAALSQAYIFAFGPRLLPIEHYVWFAMRAGVLLLLEGAAWGVHALWRRWRSQ